MSTQKGTWWQTTHAPLQHLQVLTTSLDGMLLEMRAMHVQQQSLNLRQEQIAADIKQTLAGIETLLAKLVQQQDTEAHP